MQIYDILHPYSALAKWTQCKRLPVSDVRDAQAVWLGDRLYLGGGIASKVVRNAARLYIYTPARDMWKIVSTPVYRFSLVVYQSQLVLVGGIKYINERNDGYVTNRLWTFITGHIHWRETFPPMAIERHSASAVEFANNILVAGGENDEYGDINIVEVYNGHYWTKAQCLPKPFRHKLQQSTVLNGCWYLMGGVRQVHEIYYASLNVLLFSCQKFIPSVWTRLHCVPDNCLSVVMFGNRLTAIVGGSIISTSSSIHAYSPYNQSWVHMGDIPVKLYSACATVLPTGELMVMSYKDSCVHKTSLIGGMLL